MEGIRAERQVTLIMVTHDPAVAAGADRVLRMKDGRIAGEAAIERPADLTALKSAIER